MRRRSWWPAAAGAMLGATVATALAGNFSWWFALATVAFAARAVLERR